MVVDLTVKAVLQFTTFKLLSMAFQYNHRGKVENFPIYLHSLAAVGLTVTVIQLLLQTTGRGGKRRTKKINK